jgi:hypothetical protein
MRTLGSADIPCEQAVLILELHGVVEIAASYGYVCARTSRGDVLQPETCLGPRQWRPCSVS